MGKGGRGGGGGWGSIELPVDLTGKYPKIVVFYLAKSPNKKSETSEFHEGLIFYTYFNSFCRYVFVSIRVTVDQIAQKVSKQLPLNASNPHYIK